MNDIWNMAVLSLYSICLSNYSLLSSFLNLHLLDSLLKANSSVSHVVCVHYRFHWVAKCYVYFVNCQRTALLSVFKLTIIGCF